MSSSFTAGSQGRSLSRDPFFLSATFLFDHHSGPIPPIFLSWSAGRKHPPARRAASAFAFAPSIENKRENSENPKKEDSCRDKCRYQSGTRTFNPVNEAASRLAQDVVCTCWLCKQHRNLEQNTHQASGSLLLLAPLALFGDSLPSGSLCSFDFLRLNLDHDSFMASEFATLALQ